MKEVNLMIQETLNNNTLTIISESFATKQIEIRLNRRLLYCKSCP